MNPIDFETTITETAMNIPFSPPDISDVEIEEVVETLRSGWITTGPKTKKLEHLLSDYLGTERCVCLNSQTACSELCLRILGIGPGDEVITSAYTYTATASVVCHVGARLVLIDSQRDSFEMDYDALEKAITCRTKAVIPVDLGGVPCDYERIFEIVEKNRTLFQPVNELQSTIGRVAVIADGAHALGARARFCSHWKMVGSIADFTNFSFHAVKNLTTAEGGAVTWNIPGADNDEIYRQFQLYSLHGQSKDALMKEKSSVWEYDVIGPWYKCNMTDVMAAIGIGQIQRYSGMLKRRRDIIGVYNEAFVSIGIKVLPHYTESHESSGHLYITRIPGITTKQRQEIMTKMMDQGIAVNVHYKPLPMFTAYRKLGFDIKDYQNAYNFYANEVTLPLYSRLTDSEVVYIIQKYTQILETYL